MANKLQRSLLILEVVILFGPIMTLFLFAWLIAILGVFQGFGEASIAFLVLITLSFGTYGLYVALNLARRSIGEIDNLPKSADPVFGLICGSLPCLVFAVILISDLIPVALLFLAPVIGGVHLLYLNKDILRTSPTKQQIVKNGPQTQRNAKNPEAV